MNGLKNILTALVLVLATVPFVAADDRDKILDQKRELERIKEDVGKSQKTLDSLRNQQVSMQRQISDADQKLSSDRKVITRLNSQLATIQKDIGRAETALADYQEQLDRTQRRFLGDIRQFYFALRGTSGTFTDNPNVERQLRRNTVFLTAMADFELGNIEEATGYLAETIDALDGLSGQSDQVKSLKKKKEVSYSLDMSRKSQHEKQLDRVRRRSMDEAERIMTLKAAAEEMERILARLEQESRRARPAESPTAGPSVFATLKGQLRSPFRGKIVVRFGNLVDPVTKLKSFSPGISIKGKAGGSVSAVASGTVAYTGNLRGYGNFVIISHDREYYTTYAGLGDIFVSEGQNVSTGVKLAASGSDGIVKFELRKGRDPLDPVTWIKFESL